jgi:hypothetical protein
MFVLTASFLHFLRVNRCFLMLILCEYRSAVTEQRYCVPSASPGLVHKAVGVVKDVMKEAKGSIGVKCHSNTQIAS